MGEFKERLTTNLKNSSLQFLIFLLRLLIGALIGLSIAISAQTMSSIGIYTFMFIVVVSMMLVLRITRSLGLLGSIIFLLVLILIGVLLKLYILEALRT
ncbi:MAG: hypothetical protein H6623_08885 [Bdellovibrionaceae bacterium]|nr:hypothetical protein [Pseudobdellovibrionaceae bacterium]